MTALGFKLRFCEPIVDGTKGGTIRAPRKDGRLIPVGGMIQFYTAMRTNQCRKIMPDRPCLDVQPVRLDFEQGLVVIADHTDQARIFTTAQRLGAFAVFDGFRDWGDLRDFWEAEHGTIRKFDGFHTRWLPWPKELVP